MSRPVYSYIVYFITKSNRFGHERFDGIAEAESKYADMKKDSSYKLLDLVKTTEEVVKSWKA